MLVFVYAPDYSGVKRLYGQFVRKFALVSCPFKGSRRMFRPECGQE